MMETESETGNERDSRSEYVYRHLLEKIRAGDIKAGERLTEVDLANQLGVSRTPVREALKSLHGRGLLQIIPGRGMELVELSMKQMIDLYEMRAGLEGMAASLAAQRGSASDINILYGLVKSYETYIAYPNSLSAINTDFHHAIYEACGNSFLQDALSTLEDALGLIRNKDLNSLARRHAIVDEHRAIVDAIARRDSGAAEMIARHHIREAQRYRIFRIDEM